MRDGIRLDGELYYDPGTGRHRMEVTATNTRSTSVEISSICAPNFTNAVERDGETVWPPPQVTCLAYGVKPFRPGESLSAVFYWNETIYESSREEPRDAPAGNYDWRGEFHYKVDEGPFEAVSGEFQIRVN